MTADMVQRRLLGGCDIEVSPIAFGLWRFVGADVHAAAAKVHAALDHGVNFFDVAAVYGLDWGGSAFGESEALLGQVFAREPALRKRIVLATKFGIVPGIPYDSSREAVIASCEASLKRLNTDVIDLFQVHRPDVLTHPADLADALSSLKKQGKIRAAGVSNYSARQALVLQQFLDFELVTHQPEYSALHLDPLHDGVFDQCLSRNMTPMAWSPLGGGRLTMTLHDAHAADPSGRLAKVIAALDHAAAKHGVSRTIMALAFVMRHPARPIPVIGTQTPSRIAEAMRADGVSLTRAEWYTIASAAGMPLP
jgi:aryl-alcohol dehydrogenase-like predicted oxidoreductase